MTLFVSYSREIFETGKYIFAFAVPLLMVYLVTHACRKRRLKWVATLPLGDINTEA
jgi:hypothetical protein